MLKKWFSEPVFSSKGDGKEVFSLERVLCFISQFYTWDKIIEDAKRLKKEEQQISDCWR